MFDVICQDVRYALRALRTTPGFAAVAILSLALGIGGNTAIFSLINSVILRSLPVSHPEELLHLTMGKQLYFSNPTWEALRDRQDVFSGIFAYGQWTFNLANGGEVRNAHGQYVSGQYFETLGVRTALGRTLTPADDQRGCRGAAVLSHGFWQREYGGRVDVLGKTISIDNRALEIVGVTQAGFTGVEVGSSVDVLAPLCAQTGLIDANYANGWGWLEVIGRPRPGISPGQVTARLRILAPEILRASLPRNWRSEDRQAYLQHTIETEPAGNGLSRIRSQYREALLILMVVVAVVLLIACLNVANLLLARGRTREREIAIRMALGSGRSRLLRQFLTESLLLSGTGAALGILLAQWAARLLAGFLNADLDLTLDARVLAFTAGTAVLTGVLFGLAPAWRGTRVQPQAAMRSNSRGVVEGSRFSFGKLFVILQVSLSVLLVVGAGLMLSTLWKLASVDAGFKPEQVLLATVTLREGSYSPERRAVILREMLERLRAIPGVHSASASNIIPMCGCKGAVDVVVDGYVIRSRDDANVLFNKVSDGYFETMGTAIVAGRDFDSHDTPVSVKVAIINRSMARKYFDAANPVGRRVSIQEGADVVDSYEIAGMVEDAKYGTLREQMAPTLYLTRNQDLAPGSPAYFELRAAVGPPGELVTQVKSVVGNLDRETSLEFTTLAARIGKSLSRERLLAALSGIFGAFALLLATIGLYGVMSYNVVRRRSEIAIRLALGAEPARVLAMVMGEVAVLIAAGLGLGLGVALVTTRFASSFLYGVKPNDPATLSAVAAVLAGVGAIAGYLPARRASRLDPMVNLREE